MGRQPSGTAGYSENIVYGEQKKRGFFKLNAMSLGFAIGGIVFVIVALGRVVAVPVVLQYVGLSNAADLSVRIGRWPTLLVGVALALTCICRFGPSRETPQWTWITWGQRSRDPPLARSIRTVLVLRRQLWHLQSDPRILGCRHRLHDLAADFGPRHPAGR